MTPALAKAAVKEKFDIETAVTTFDTLIASALERATMLLSPFVSSPLTVNTSVSLAQTATQFTLPVASSTLKRLHLVFGTSTTPSLWTDWSQHGDTILLTETLPSTATAYIYAEGDFAITDTVPVRFAPAWVDWGCSEFATILAGSKSKYNIYAQQTGARGVDNMLDLAEFYEQRAERRIARVADSEGIL